ncbi:MAG: hypothetical protein RL199_158, partial [Pseudomonadota bacterium]
MKTIPREAQASPKGGADIAAFLLLVAGLGVVAWNLADAWAWARYGYLGPDDFQHAHNGWLSLRGRLVFRDFFDNHGPLFAWLNALLLWVRGTDAATFESILRLRTVHWAALGVQCLLLHALSRRLSFGRAAAMVTVASHASFQLLATTGPTIRPDGWQVAVVLGAALLFLGGRPLRAGMLVGVALLLHAKGLLAVGAMLAGVAAFQTPGPVHGLSRTCGRAALGTGLVAGAVLLFFAVHGGLDALVGDMLRYNFGETGNRLATARAVNRIVRERQVAWMKADAVILSFAAVGLGWLLARWWRREAAPSERFIAAATIGTCPILALPLYPQASMCLLPYAALCAGWLVERAGRGGSHVPAGVGLAIAGLAGSPLLQNSPSRAKAAEQQASLRAELDWMLSRATRSERVLYVWPAASAAHVFQENADVRWMLPANSQGGPSNSIVDAAHERTMSRLAREELMGAKTIHWFVAEPRDYAVLPAELRTALDEGFERRGNVWRREATTRRDRCNEPSRHPRGRRAGRAPCPAPRPCRPARRRSGAE